MRVGVGVGGLVGSLSDDDQRTVVDAMYDVAGRPVPYAEQETAGHRVAGMLLDKGAETTGAAGEELGAQELGALQGSELLPRTGRLVQYLKWGGEATPETALVLVGTAVIFSVYHSVSMEMQAGPIDPHEATGFHYTGLTWVTPGSSIYYGANAPTEGAYLFTADDWDGPVRWFDEPCTFSDFTPPAGDAVHMMSGEPSWQPGLQPRCQYPVPPPTYWAEADVYVDYPYVPEVEVKPAGPAKPYSDSDPVRNYPDTGPAPPVSVAGPGIASALGGDGGPLGDALDEALLASDLVAQNPDDITEEQAPVVARECLRRLVAAGESSPRDACRELPILAEGVEGGEATDLDIDALAANPYWVLLHYYQRGPNNQWYASEPECASEVGKQCHEYPFWSTEEGGPPPAGGVRPWLRMVPASDNQSHGAQYGGFLTKCRISTSGTPFLGIPLSPSLGIPTRKLCNFPPVP